MALTHNIDEALRIAAQSGNLKKLKELIDEKALYFDFPQNLDKTNHLGMSVLHVAVKSSQLDAARMIIEAGANVNQRKNNSDTSLITALKTHLGAPASRHPLTLPVIKLLIDSKANVNEKNNSFETPLHFAGHDKCGQCALWLIDAGAFLSPMTRVHEAPLHWAALKGYVEPIKALLAAGANPNPVTRKDYRSPLETAALWGHYDAIIALVKGGAEIDESVIKIASPDIRPQVEALFERQKLESVLNGKRNEDDQTSGNTLAL